MNLRKLLLTQGNTQLFMVDMFSKATQHGEIERKISKKENIINLTIGRLKS